MTLRMFDCRKPVIAAVNGAAVGIGVTMLLPMDARIASSEARFGFVFSQRGIVPEAASSWFLPRIVGIAQALDWCYSGRVFGADEALAGQAGQPRGRAGRADRRRRARSRAASSTNRAGLDRADPADDVAHARRRATRWRRTGIDSKAMFHRGRSADVKEGITSFLEKRPARFTDTVSRDLPELPWGEEPTYR